MKITDYLYTILIALIVLLLSLIPTDGAFKEPIFFFPGIDKVIHIIMYTVLGSSFVYSYFKRRELKINKLVALGIIVWFYSLFIELLQQFLVSSRSGELLDLLANLAGVIIGILAYYANHRIRS